jgi:hypothetical protein
LEAGHNETLIIRNPFADPTFFSWRLDNEQSTSRLSWTGEEPLTGDRISGVFVRGPAWIDAAGWQPDDLAYMLAETQAAFVGGCGAWIVRWSTAIPRRSGISLEHRSSSGIRCSGVVACQLWKPSSPTFHNEPVP